MVKLNFELNSTLTSHSNSININGVSYIEELESTNFNHVFNFDANIDDTIEIVILTRPIIKNTIESKNIINKIISTLVMFVITGWSTSIYDCDCWNYKTNISLIIRKFNPKVNIRINEQTMKNKSSFKIDVKGCDIFEKQTYFELNEKYFKKLFIKFNIWRTRIFTIIFSLILLTGIFVYKISTIIFSSVLLFIFLFAYFYNKKYLSDLMMDIQKMR